MVVTVIRDSHEQRKIEGKLEFCNSKFSKKMNFFFCEITFALYTVGRVTGDEGKLKANGSCLNRQIQTTQFAFSFPPNFPSFKALIIHEREKFCFPRTVIRTLAGIKFSFAMLTIRDHPSAMSCPYFWKFSGHREVKSHCCNKFPNECIGNLIL